MTTISRWIKTLFANRTRPNVKRVSARAALGLEVLESRVVPALQLAYGGVGSVLRLSEVRAGNDTVTVSEPVAGQLRINLGAGTFAATSSVRGIVYQNPGSPSTSHFATVNIGQANAISTLAIDLGASTGFFNDSLTLGLTNSSRGVRNVTVTDSNVSNTKIDLNSISLVGGSLNVRGGAIRVLPGASLTTQGGSLTLRGTGLDVINRLSGVDINNAVLDAGANGAVNVTGTGATTTAAGAFGVAVRGGAIVQGGVTSIIGTGGFGAGGFDFGVLVDSASKVTAFGTGDVVVRGTGGTSTGFYNFGVYVRNGGQIGSRGGNVSVVGQGGGFGGSAFNIGVVVENGGVITAGGTGRVTVQGTGGNGTSNAGVSVAGLGAQITSAGGAVQIIGTGRGTGVNDGIRVVSDGVITSGGSGVLTLNGTGTIANGSAGTRISSGGRVTAGGGDATRNLGLTASSVLVVALTQANTESSGYEFVHVDGTVDLGRATLQATADSNLAVGSSYQLLNNAGTSALDGLFAQGASLNINGYTFALDYAAGDGNGIRLSNTPDFSDIGGDVTNPNGDGAGDVVIIATR